MKNESYKRAYEDVQRELAEVNQQRQALDKRSAKLKQTLLSLDALMVDETESTPDTGLPFVGLTDACRCALKATKLPSTAVEVRDWLVNAYYDLSDQENALASIHTILKRLVESGEAEAGTNEQGKSTYRWIEQVPVSASFGVNIESSQGIRKTLGGDIKMTPLSESVAERLKKKRPAWAEYLAQRGGIILSNPPYYADGSKLTVRQRRELNEALEAETKKKD